MKKSVFTVAATVALSGAFATTVSAEEYTINKGDTLWSISQKYNVSVDQLKSWNDLSSNLIFPNQRLTVSAESSSDSQASPSVQSATTYTVQSGDTLWGISHKFGISVDQLMAWNQLSSTLIHPGDQFTVNGQAAPAATTQSTSTTQTTTNTSTQNNADSDVVKQFTAEATAYTAFCAGCSGVTATGIDLRANPDQKVIAVDPDVIPLGSKVWVEGYGVAIAGDTGGAINGQRIDVFIPDREEALEFGRRTVTVKVLN